MKTSQSSLHSFQLSSLSPLDGRYQEYIAELHTLFSEYALLKFRTFVEIEWLQTMISVTNGNKNKALNPKTRKFLNNIFAKFSLEDAKHIKEIEKKINHDTKAVEYFIKEKITDHPELQKHYELIHFGCTSDDTNNLAYALMLKEARDKCLLPQLQLIIQKLRDLAHTNANTAMLARTHGQPATPTTVGKELANFTVRLENQYNKLASTPIMGKFNGTTGNYNALCVAFPEQKWPAICQKFVSALDLTFNPYTTQIEPHDHIVDICQILSHNNSIMIGLCRDIWSYISLNYFGLKMKQQEVGSSTMPHKINPIDFENAEGNLGLANALLYHLANKLPISRWQRDLSDSTVLRNIGASLGYCLLAYKSLHKGLSKIAVNQQKLTDDLDQHWEVLAEAIQTVMRRYNIANPYEKLKTLTRGQKINKKTLHEFVEKLNLPQEAKRQLFALTPHNYLGKANELAKKV